MLIEEEVLAVLASELVLLIIGVTAAAIALVTLLLPLMLVDAGVIELDCRGPERGTIEEVAVIPILLPIRGCMDVGTPVDLTECADEAALLSKVEVVVVEECIAS